MRIVVIKWIKSRTSRERRHLYIHVNRVASGFTDRALISRGSGFDARNRVKLKDHQCRTPSRSNISTNYFRVATEGNQEKLHPIVQTQRVHVETCVGFPEITRNWRNGRLRPLVISARDGKQKGKR